MSIGSSSKVKAEGFSLRNHKILVMLLLAKLNTTIEENLKEYFGHSTSRCDLDWNCWKHVHPHGSSGKNCCRYSPVGACPEISLVKWLKVAMSPANAMNCLPLPSQAWGNIILHLFFNWRSFLLAKTDQVEHHSLITSARLYLIQEAMLCAGKGGGPMIVTSASLSASLLMSKPKWLGIHQNSIELLWDRLSQSPTYRQLFRESLNAECGFVLKSNFNMDWLSIKNNTGPSRLCMIYSMPDLPCAFRHHRMNGLTLVERQSEW